MAKYLYSPTLELIYTHDDWLQGCLDDKSCKSLDKAKELLKRFLQKGYLQEVSCPDVGVVMAKSEFS